MSVHEASDFLFLLISYFTDFFFILLTDMFFNLFYIHCVLINVNSLVIRHKGESQDGGNKKTEHAKFSEKKNLLAPDMRTGAYQRVRNIRFSENMACFVSLLTPS